MAGFTYYVKIFIALLVLVNPLEGIPFFLQGTSKSDSNIQAAVARRAGIAVAAILLIAALFGSGMLRVFGVSIGAFQIGGGVVLFLIAIRMVLSYSNPAPVQTPDDSTGMAFAIVPLAIPLLAGPGAIAGAILYGTRMRSIGEMAILAGIIVLVSVTAYASLRGADILAKYLKDTGISVVTSIMGLIITAIAIEMIGHGLNLMFGLKIFNSY